MRIELLGTGSQRGWPEPDCTCASCRSAAATPRQPTRIVVDGVIQLDDNPPTAMPRGWKVTPVDNAALLLQNPDGQRLLYGTPTTRLHGAGPLDIAVLRQPGLDRALAALRRAGTITADTLTVAVGLGHDNPPAPELAALLWTWGVVLPRDGDVLSPTGLPAAGQLPRRTLVTGGSRSGKSLWAEKQLAADPTVIYIATAQPRSDPDFERRIATHQARRSAHWQTVETLDLVAALGRTQPGSLLIDDLGNWVARTMDLTNGWDGDLGAYRHAAAELVRAWSAYPGRVVLVSNEVGSGVHPATSSGRIFSDEIGRLTGELAAESDEVIGMVAGLAQWLRRPPGMIVA